MPARPGTEVDQPVGLPDDVEVVLAPLGLAQFLGDLYPLTRRTESKSIAS
jgi:hypothetical protein